MLTKEDLREMRQRYLQNQFYEYSGDTDNKVEVLREALDDLMYRIGEDIEERSKSSEKVIGRRLSSLLQLLNPKQSVLLFHNGGSPIFEGKVEDVPYSLVNMYIDEEKKIISLGAGSLKIDVVSIEDVVNRKG